MYENEIKKYRMVFDHHTHTIYSHGIGTIIDNVKAAHEKGLSSIAITDHGPGHRNFGMKLADLPKMKKDIEEAKLAFPDMEILLGIEANTKRKEPYIDITLDEAKEFDLVLAGYHYGIGGAGMIPNYVYRHLYGNEGLSYTFDENGEPQAEITSLMIKNTRMIMNALNYNEENGNHIYCVTHPGDKGPFDIYDIAKTCELTGTYLEINGKHKHLTIKELEVAKLFDVKFLISSDAHNPEKVGTFEPQLERLLVAGIDPERVVNIEKK